MQRIRRERIPGSAVSVVNMTLCGFSWASRVSAATRKLVLPDEREVLASEVLELPLDSQQRMLSSGCLGTGWCRWHAQVEQLIACSTACTIISARRASASVVNCTRHWLSPQGPRSSVAAERLFWHCCLLGDAEPGGQGQCSSAKF